MIVLGILLSVLAGLIPVLLYAGLVNWLDQYEKEPWWLLLVVALWGAAPAVIMALVSQLILEIPTTWIFTTSSLAYEVIGSSLWAPVTEEIAKGLGVVMILLLARREVDSVLDGIIYGAVCGLGFAFTENVLYFVTAFAEAGWGDWVVVVLLRTIPFGLNHALFTGLTGAGVAAAFRARSRWTRVLAILGGLLAGVSFHAIHNLGASLSDETCAPICASFVFDWGGLLLLFLLVIYIWREEKSWMAAQLPGEIRDDLYMTITSWGRWQGARWGTLLRGNLKGWRNLGRIRQAAAELAFKKNRLAISPVDHQMKQDIAGFRQRLVELGAAPPPPPTPLKES